jgi:CheY-like chemotaxis protein
MPVTGSIANGVLHVAVVGEYDFGDVQRAITAALDQSAPAAAQAMVYDMRSALTQPMADEVRARAAWIARLRTRGLRACAVVVRPGSTMGTAGMQVLQSLGVPVRLFPTVATAEEWAAAHVQPHADGQDGAAMRPAPTSIPWPLPVSLAGLTVLIVDDNPHVLDLFSTVLETAGATVRVATSAGDALRGLCQLRPDAIVSDLEMPGADGFWLLREIQKLPDEALRRIPIVAATAHGREHSNVETRAAGFVDHLQKPIGPDHLCRAVATAAGR